MIHDARNAARAKSGDGACHDGINRTGPRIIALDQITAGKVGKAGGKFRVGQGDQHPAKRRYSSKAEPDQGTVRPSAGGYVKTAKEHEAKTRDDKAAAGMALQQGKAKHHRKRQPAALLIQPFAKRHARLSHETIQAGDHAQHHQNSEGIAVGKAAGPVAQMGGFGKPERRFPPHHIGEGRKPDLHYRRKDDGDADLLNKAMGMRLGDQRGECKRCRIPDEIRNTTLPRMRIKRDVIGVKRGGLAWPDGQRLQDHPSRYQTNHKPNVSNVAWDKGWFGCGAAEADRDQADAGQDRQNAHGPTPCAAQQNRGQNDLGQQANMRQPIEQSTPRAAFLWLKNKALKVAQNFRVVACSDQHAVRWGSP